MGCFARIVPPFRMKNGVFLEKYKKKPLWFVYIMITQNGGKVNGQKNAKFGQINANTKRVNCKRIVCVLVIIS